jgi:hypothetical protein
MAAKFHLILFLGTAPAFNNTIGINLLTNLQAHKITPKFVV